MNTYGYVGGNPLEWIDPLGLWSISIDFYYGWGGAIVFGKNPDGSVFISPRGGYGLGGGISYDPNGTSPGYDCNKEYIDYYAGGAFGGLNVALGPLHAGLNGKIGVRTENGSSYDWYYDAGPSYGASWDGKWGLRLGGAVGLEAAAVENKKIIIANTENICKPCN